MEIFKAPKGLIYKHKSNSLLYGEAVVITPEDVYSIEDFDLIDKEEHKKLLIELEENNNKENE
jgi:hypothetical protein